MYGVTGSLAVAEDDEPTVVSRSVIGGYTVGERIGTGGLAEVYAAQDTYAEREVALKILRPKYCALSEFVERMQREAVVMMRLRNPNIVTCWAAGLDGRRPWLALERLRGMTMRQTLSDGPLWPQDVLSLGRQAALGLRAAHRGGIIHRDLKPENLFIERDRLVLLDFGFAKSAHHGPLTDPFGTPGTIAYMAPEQILRRPADARTDVYALGVCLYEALAGHHPFVNEPGAWPSDDVLARFHIEDPPYPLPELMDGFPSSVWAIIAKCMAKDRNDRYADMRELAADLAQQDGVIRTYRRRRLDPIQKQRKDSGESSHARATKRTGKGAGGRDVCRSDDDRRRTVGQVVERAPRAGLEQPSSKVPGCEPVRGSGGWAANVGANGTVAWMEIADCCLYVGSRRAPTEADWNAYLDWLAPRCRPGSLVRTLVLERSDGPTAAQRVRLGRVTSKCAGRVAVVTESRMMRGVVTALNWLKEGSYRAFAPARLTDAIAYLGLTARDAQAMREASQYLMEALTV